MANRVDIGADQAGCRKYQAAGCQRRARSPVTMLGAFPPPVGGAAKNNQLLLEELQQQGVAVRKIDISGGALSHRRGWVYHWQRSLANAKAVTRILAYDSSVLYMVPDGGWGVLYSLGHVRLAAWRFRRLVLHHRTFRYINSRSAAMASIVSATGAKAVHVFLSAGMADQFQERYGPVKSIISTNAHYVAEAAGRTLAAEPQRSAARLRIGHLSNLCREKGFFDVADAFEKVVAQGIDAELHLGGPVVEKAVEPRLKQLVASHGDRVAVHGPLHADAKEQFYRHLHLFLFPTRFSQEAAPNVIYEAFAGGAVVLSVARACIGEMVYGERGAVCAAPEEFADFVVDYIRRYSITPKLLEQRARRVVTSIAEEAAVSRGQHEELQRLLVS